MCGCLLFLTGINFFVYGQAENKHSTEQFDSSSSEEQSSDGEESSDLIIQEEYVHEFHLEHQPIVSNIVTKYATLVEEKNHMVHYELIAPPPDL